MKKLVTLLFNISLPFFLIAQNSEIRSSINKYTAPELHVNSYAEPIKNKTNLTPRCLIIPASLISYGFFAMGNNSLKSLNRSTKAELQEDHSTFKTKVDNYLQYSPVIAVYALNAVGIKGKNNFRDRSIIYALSTLFATATVQSIKRITRIERPDGSCKTSFPSGHTTTAFAAAEFLHMEYKDQSAWYGIAGYVAATATGVMRLYNNKHWVSDVVAGAGFGILSTKLAYWIYPAIKRKFFKDRTVNTMIIPYYQAGNSGLSMVYNFHQ